MDLYSHLHSAIRISASRKELATLKYDYSISAIQTVIRKTLARKVYHLLSRHIDTVLTYNRIICEKYKALRDCKQNGEENLLESNTFSFVSKQGMDYNIF